MASHRASGGQSHETRVQTPLHPNTWLYTRTPRLRPVHLHEPEHNLYADIYPYTYTYTYNLVNPPSRNTQARRPTRAELLLQDHMLPVRV